MDDADDPTPEDARRALDRAIEERPAEVVAFVERLDRANDVLDGTRRSTDRERRPRRTPAEELLDGFAETTSALFGAGTGTENPAALATLATAVGTNAGDMERALRKLAALERDGTLRDLAEAGETLRQFETELGEETADLLEDPTTAGEVGRMLRALEAAEAAPETRLGLVGFARELRDEEVQRGMGYLVALARELGREE
ncbi:DUF1641 domain-containing protein [Salinirubellus salinus]|jgi:uncharacterized protein YjgD (DUF1641 family)|uniref:DUF1641 domain-containing protein n=1 Tax=Salinirubellus salinus TaxID=1364945 RepID=A0A9E7R253_9EURY|nr:DUF1641 domain-containing protein [Salinirubellus salinus]UWM53844.1 DUF1641 domain-containing protein [Salinirubellus salinus]